jgi:hypothetical protein
MSSPSAAVENHPTIPNNNPKSINDPFSKSTNMLSPIHGGPPPPPPPPHKNPASSHNVVINRERTIREKLKNILNKSELDEAVKLNITDNEIKALIEGATFSAIIAARNKNKYLKYKIKYLSLKNKLDNF